MSNRSGLTQDGNRQNLRQVFYDSANALTNGQGVCYERTSATRTAATSALAGSRDLIVKDPSVTNNHDFAGVVVGDYAARTGGQSVTIAEPGSVADINVTATSVTVGDYLTCDCGDDVGDFKDVGFVGRGSVRILQTLAAAGTAQGYLMTGEESGLVQRIAPATGAEGAVVLSPTGITIFDGTNLTGADSTFTLADGNAGGLRKGFVYEVAVTGAGSDLVITVTSGLQLGATTALATLTFATAAQEASATWHVNNWQLVHNSGAAQA